MLLLAVRVFADDWRRGADFGNALGSRFTLYKEAGYLVMPRLTRHPAALNAAAHRDLKTLGPASSAGRRLTDVFLNSWTNGIRQKIETQRQQK